MLDLPTLNLRNLKQWIEDGAILKECDATGRKYFDVVERYADVICLQDAKGKRKRFMLRDEVPYADRLEPGEYIDIDEDDIIPVGDFSLD